jgi:hypothetical protein
MRRAGGWILGFCIVAAMAGGGWLTIRKVLARETLYVEVTRGHRDPSTDAMMSGIRFALDEAGNRAGGFRIEILDSPLRSPLGPNVYISMGDFILLEANPPPDTIAAAIMQYDEALKPLRVLTGQKELGMSAALWAGESGSTRTVLLCDDQSPKSRLISLGFEERGPRLIARYDTIGVEHGPDLKSSLETLTEAVLLLKPDLVFYSGEEPPYSRTFEIFAALRKKGYAGRLAMGDADPEVSFLAIPTRVVEGTLLISPIGPPSKEFAIAYEPATGRHAGPHAWPGYLLMKAVLDRVERAGSRNVEKLRGAFYGNPLKPLPPALYVARNGKFEFVQDLK